MRIIHCEQCITPLPWTAKFCTVCGAAVSLHPLIFDYPDDPGQSTKQPDTGSLKTSSFHKMGPDGPDETQPFDHAQVGANSTTLLTVPALDGAASRACVEEWLEEEELDGETLHGNTWQKIVTRKTLALPVGAIASSTPSTLVRSVLPAPPSCRIGAGTPLPEQLAPPLPSIRSSLRPPR